MNQYRREEPYRSVLSTPYGSGNHGDGEIIADCYMIFLIQHVGGASYRYPPAASAYQGDEALRRFRALLDSPAFACYVGPGSELRSNAQHFHLLLRTAAYPLSTVMRRLLTGHAIIMGKKKKDGKMMRMF